MDFTRTTELTPEVISALEDAFECHYKWDATRIAAGERVRKSLVSAARVIIQNVPPCPDRTVALRKAREVMADSASAIIHGGAF